MLDIKYSKNTDLYFQNLKQSLNKTKMATLLLEHKKKTLC